MNTATAGTIAAGQTVTTIPSIASGRTTADTFTVTEVEAFAIKGHEFVELHHEGGSHTMSAATLVSVA